jgi:hypothetical protein
MPGIHGAAVMTSTLLRRPILLAALLAVLSVFATSPARADRCNDIANQLKTQIDGLKVGITAANVIYLSHPMAKEMSLGCPNRKYANELFVKSFNRKPKTDFTAFVAGAAAIVFTLPKDELTKGVSGCLSRMGFFRGDDVSIRFRRLDMNCTRTKTDAAIAITRGLDQ